MKKRVLITVGGTGGHVYPAMALAKQLQNSDTDILFVGGGLATNRYFESTAFQYRQVDCGNFRRNPIACLQGMQKIVQGLYQSSCIIKEYRPDVVVGFGSYYTLPTLLAAKLQNIPIVLHEANRIPGKVNRLLSKYVDITGVHFPDTGSLLKGKTVEAKIPLREGYQLDHVSTQEARKHYDLAPDLLTLLVFGGSQGAHAINHLFAEALLALPDALISQLQVLHITGDSLMTQQLRAKYAAHGISAHVKDFENQMNLAWQAADLMVSRAGAGTVAEQLEYEVPGILIPYPHATDNHQEKNADFMVEKVGGAIKCLERTLVNNQLAQKLTALLSKEQQQLEIMRQAMQAYKRNTQPCDFYSVVLKVMHKRL
jgi:UDP-N-acetylglucosamine--N-acetylmuramyl-(pentapeptide) pyrophosphoryl-undecaprenol N-acetylglucosamine transferase